MRVTPFVLPLAAQARDAEACDIISEHLDVCWTWCDDKRNEDFFDFGEEWSLASAATALTGLILMRQPMAFRELARAPRGTHAQHHERP